MYNDPEIGTNCDYCGPEDLLKKLERLESENRKVYARLNGELAGNLTKTKRKEILEELKKVRDEYNKIKAEKRIARHMILNNQPERK